MWECTKCNYKNIKYTVYAWKRKTFVFGLRGSEEKEISTKKTNMKFIKEEKRRTEQTEIYINTICSLFLFYYHNTVIKKYKTM